MAQISSAVPKTKNNSLLAELARDLRPDRLVSGVTTGMVCGVLCVIIAFSFAALFFSGELSPFLPLGIGLIALGIAVMCLTTVLLSSHASTIADIQEGRAPFWLRSRLQPQGLCRRCCVLNRSF